MGSCGSKNDVEAKRNKEIEREMGVARNTDQAKIKLLLLGAGESGKSTFFKQMKLLYSETRQFTSAEKENYVAIIYSNIYADIKALVSSCSKHTPLQSPNAASAGEILLKAGKGDRITPSEATLMETVWKDKGAQQTWANRGDIQIQDALEYYMANIHRIGAPGYMPTDQDILRSRVRTSGVVQESFQIDATNFEIYDVGGQRNERRKWIHSFDGVTSVMFIAAISEYNQVLYEDSNVNRQDEAVELFRQQLSSEYFLNTPVILFLNKIDLFREKLPKIPFRVDNGPYKRNTDFEGPFCDSAKVYKTSEPMDPEFQACYDAARFYLQDLYEKQSPAQRTQSIYTHFTNSTDTNNIEHIMSACKDIILKQNLVLGGWLTD